MMKRAEIAELCSVKYDKENDEVYITFKVVDDKYKEMALRFAKRKDIELIIRGEKLDIKYLDDGDEDASI